MALHITDPASGSFAITDTLTTETVELGDTITFKSFRNNSEIGHSGALEVAISAPDTVTYTLTEALTALELQSTGTSSSDVRLRFVDENDDTTLLQLISQDVGNLIVAGSDKGLYVNAVSSFNITDGSTTQTVNSGDTINFVATGDLSLSVDPTDTVTFDFTETTTSWIVAAGGVNPTLRYINENATTSDVVFAGGTNVTVIESNGTVTISASAIGATSNVTAFNDGNIIARHFDGIATFVDIDETITSWGVQQTGLDPILRYTAEGGGTSDVQFAGGTNVTVNESSGIITISAAGAGGNTSIITNNIAGNRIATHNDGTGTTEDIDETITSWVVASGASNPILRYTREGGGQDDIQLKGGTNVSVTEVSGIITIDANPGGDGAVSAVNNVIAGNRIATHSNGIGGSVDIDESITSWGILIGGSDPTIRYAGETANYDFQYVGGNNVTVTSSGGTITWAAADETNTTITGLLGAGNIIGTYNNENSTAFVLRETITSWGVGVGGADPTLRYTAEDGTLSNIQFVGGTNITINEAGGTVTVDGSGLAGDTSVVTNVIAGNRIATHDDGNGTLVDIDETITTWGVQSGGANPTLRYTREGGVTSDVQFTGGTNVTINESGGNITVNSSSGATSVITNTVGGNRIATHNNGLGVLSDIDETITSLSGPTSSFIGSNDVKISYTSETGAVSALQLVSSDANNDIISGSDQKLYAPPETTTLFISSVSDHQIASYLNELGIFTGVFETNTSWGIGQTGLDPILRHTNESGTQSNVQFAGGSNVSVNESGGIITISASGIGDTSIITNTIAGNRIATHNDGGGILSDIDETITSVSYNSILGGITHLKEGGTSDQFTLVSNLLSSNILSYDSAGLNAYVNVTNSITGNATGGTPLQLVNDVGVPPASYYYGTNASGTKGWHALPPGGGGGGGWIVSDGTNSRTIDPAEVLTMTGLGDINVTVTDPDTVTIAFTEAVTSISNLKAGSLIGRYTNENGTNFDIDETITSLTSSSSSSNTAVQLYHSKENGGSDTINLVSNNSPNAIKAGTDGGLLVDKDSLCDILNDMAVIIDPEYVIGITAGGVCGKVLVETC